MGKTGGKSPQEISGTVQRKKKGKKTQGQKQTESKRADDLGWTDRLLHHDALPSYLRDNEYLHKHHRPQLDSAIECFKSVFRIHTETGNIWTHLVGTIAFSLYTMYFIASDADVPMKLTFSVYLCSVIFGMGASTVFHTLACHSPDVCIFLNKLDYCGIIIMIVASFTPWLYYGFYCRTAPAIFYQASVFAFGLACTVFVLKDKFSQPEYRPIRAGLFMGLGLSGVIPALHYIITEGILHILQAFCWLVLMAVLYLFGGTVYALRIPERLWPGKFDIMFHSHQIMHVCVIGAAMVGYKGILSLVEYRQQNAHCDDIIESL